MAESIQQLLRQESVAPAEVARTTPNYKSSEFQGGQLQLGAAPALPAHSSEEVKYKNLAAIAGGLGQALDTFTQIAEAVDKKTLAEVQAKLNELDAENIDPRTKLKRFTEIADGTTTIVAPNSWETNMMAEAKKRFGHKALNEYTMDKFKEDASQDPDFGGDIEDEEFLGRFLPKWKSKNPTLTYTDPIKTLDGKLTTQARERDRQLFLMSLVHSYSQELNLSPELINGLKDGSVSIDDPRFSPEFVELWNASSILSNPKEFMGFANSRVVSQLRDFPEVERLPPQQIELITKSIMKEIQGPLSKMWDLRTDISIANESKAKATTYETLFAQVSNNPTDENLLKFLNTAKNNFIPRNAQEASKFAIRTGEAVWKNLEKTLPNWNNLSERAKYDIWESQVDDALEAYWSFPPTALSRDVGLRLALNASTTIDPVTQKPRLISIYADSNVKGTITSSTENQSNLLIISGKTDQQAYRDVLLDTLQKYTGATVPIDSPEMKALEQLIFDEVKDKDGVVVGFEVNSVLSSEKLRAWQEKYPEEFKKLKKQGFEVTKDTIDTLRESWAKLTTEYQRVQSHLESEKNQAGGVDPQHYNASNIRHQILTKPEIALARWSEYQQAVKEGRATTPEVSNTGRMLVTMDAEATGSLYVGTFLGVLNTPPDGIKKLAEQYSMSEVDLANGILQYRNATPEEQQVMMTNAENPIAIIARHRHSVTFDFSDKTPYITWIRENSGGKASNLVANTNRLQEELNSLEPGSKKYNEVKGRLNTHFAMLEYHLRSMGSVSVSTDDPVLSSLKKEIIPLLRDRGLMELMNSPTEVSKATLIMATARGLADSPALQAVFGTQDQNDVKYLRMIGSTLKGIQGIYSPEFMIYEHKRVLDVLFKAFTGSDQEGILTSIPPDLMKIFPARADEAINQSDVMSFVLRGVFQGDEAGTKKDNAKVLAAFISGNWKLLNGDISQVNAVLREFISSNNFELGGIPIPQPGDDTYTFNGRTGGDALVHAITTALAQTNPVDGIESFLRAGVTFNFPHSTNPLGEIERSAGWRMVLGRSGPNPTSRVAFTTRRNPETGQANLVTTTRSYTPYSQDTGLHAAFKQVGLVGNNQSRGDGKTSSFPSGMPQTIPFNEEYEDESIDFTFKPYSTRIGEEFFTEDGVVSKRKTLAEIDEAFKEIFHQTNANDTGSSLVDEITPEQAYLVSALSLPVSEANVTGVMALFGIPTGDGERLQKAINSYRKSFPDESVMGFLTSQPHYQNSPEGTRHMTLAHVFVMPYFEKEVNLKTTSQGPANNQQFFIQPTGPMYWEQSQIKEEKDRRMIVNADKKIKLNTTTLPPRMGWLDDAHALAGQLQRARMQITLLQLVDFSIGRSIDAELGVLGGK